MTAAAFAGGENLARLKSKLRRHSAAMAALFGLGLDAATVDRLHLGLREPYRSRADGLETSDALCFPMLGEALRPLGRYAYVDLAGVTLNPHAPGGWGPGPPLVYRLGSFDRDAVALVAADVVDCWLAWQLSHGDLPTATFVTRSHGGGWPVEWRTREFWSRFSRVVVLPGAGSADFLRDVAHLIGRQVEHLVLPAPFSSLGQVSTGRDRPALRDLLDGARPWTVEPPRSAAAVPEDRLGRFEAAPVRIAGAYVGGHRFYPFAVETRTVEEGRGGQARLVQAYSTMVLRCDGSLLTAERLPAPAGTPADRRVLCLSDGTRILEEPVTGRTGTWSFASIERFIAWRTAGAPPPFRPLPALVADVEAYLRARVWLPMEGHHLLAALYVAMSHVFQVFEAIPLLLVCGERGTGKSELGEALARLGFNATVAGQLRAAGMIRLLDETRGLMVLDDMDGDGPASVVGTGELAQAIKTSYKSSTSRKPVADRGGRVRMVDFYGPKVVGNTRGVDPVLGSRMLAVRTAAAPPGYAPGTDRWTDRALSALRDELHAWGMACAGEVHGAYRAIPAAYDRKAEICAPLLAIATSSGDVGMLARLRAVLSDGSVSPPIR